MKRHRKLTRCVRWLRYHACKEKDSVPVINALDELKKACYSWLIHDDATVCHYREFINDPAVAAIKDLLSLSPNDANKYEETITIYTDVVSHKFRRYDTAAVNAKDDEEIRNFKQGLSTTLDFSQKVWDLTPRCGGVYNEQTLRGIFVEDIYFGFRNTIRRW